ncbi:MAG: zincin-like metallopeptidase domain-containing protein [Methanothrix sp.]|nr:zincin-like metallopeptidase domain-containing protein [Methanothrix sp.]
MKDVFEVVTNQMIKQLEEGIIPWRRPWQACWPTSYATNKEYQGINTLLLQSNYESPYWVTFRQAQKMGGSIRAGEKGRPIVFVDRIMKEEKNKEGEMVIKTIHFLKYYTVFNWCQTKGLPKKLPAERENQQIVSAEELLRRRGPRIETDIEKAYYCSQSDAIYLPTLDQFESSEDYYAAAFHELTHWTGGAGRLCRDTLRDYHMGTDVRSQEELTAEMGAAFLCQIAALDTSQTLQNSTAYIGSWLKALQNNPKWVLKASKQAREAVEYVMTGKLPEGRGRATATA